MQLDLGGNVAVVTGGASGIGWACARTFAREGCLVSVWDISSSTDEQKAALSLESSTPSHSVIVDVTDSTAVEAALRETEDTLWPVSCLVHAAAIGPGKFGFPFTKLKPSDRFKAHVCRDGK